MSSEDRADAPARPGLSAEPYANGHEHIVDLLTRHDWLLKREIARGQARKPADILGFAAITEQEVQHLLKGSAAADAAAFEALTAFEGAIQEIEQTTGGAPRFRA